MGIRVWKMSAELKANYRAARDQAELKNTDFIDLAVNTNLAGIQKVLADLGMAAASLGDEPVKLDINDESLEALREASDLTGIPAVVLARLCLTRQSKMVRVRAPKRKASKASKAKITSFTKVKAAPAKRATKAKAKAKAKAPAKRATRKAVKA